MLKHAITFLVAFLFLCKSFSVELGHIIYSREANSVRAWKIVAIQKGNYILRPADNPQGELRALSAQDPRLVGTSKVENSTLYLQTSAGIESREIIAQHEQSLVVKNAEGRISSLTVLDSRIAGYVYGDPQLFLYKEGVYGTIADTVEVQNKFQLKDGKLSEQKKQRFVIHRRSNGVIVRSRRRCESLF